MYWIESFPPDIVLGLVTVLMAGLGVMVSLHPPESLHAPGKWGVKITYASVFLFLAAIAIICVVRQSRETAVTTQNLTNALSNIGTSTTEITRVTTLNTQLQQKLLGQDAQISQLAGESFRTITGGDSFPYIAPQPTGYPGPVQLYMWDRGKYPLTGVTVSIKEDPDPSYYQPPTDVGVLHPGWGKRLGVTLVPRIDPKTGYAIFTAEMYTQSSYYTEIIHARPSHDGKFWAFKFWVLKNELRDVPDSAVKSPPYHTREFLKSAGTWSDLVYDRSQWSDEPNKSNVPAKPQ